MTQEMDIERDCRRESQYGDALGGEAGSRQAVDESVAQAVLHQRCGERVGLDLEGALRYPADLIQSHGQALAQRSVLGQCDERAPRQPCPVPRAQGVDQPRARRGQHHLTLRKGRACQCDVCGGLDRDADLDLVGKQMGLDFVRVARPQIALDRGVCCAHGCERSGEHASCQ